jgi:hypothetical protein
MRVEAAQHGFTDMRRTDADWRVQKILAQAFD